MPGIDGFNKAGVTVCCPVECGTCGGAECGSVGLPEFNNQACCPNGILGSGAGDCADTAAAPCVITDEGGYRKPMATTTINNNNNSNDDKTTT